jgi:hypothetical protein
LWNPLYLDLRVQEQVLSDDDSQLARSGTIDRSLSLVDLLTAPIDQLHPRIEPPPTTGAPQRKISKEKQLPA